MTSLSIEGINGPSPSGNGLGVFSTQGGQFGDNPFLQLLITQLQNQTPFEPVDNSAFMQQMAQFSSMEEQRELNDNLLALLSFQGALAKIQGLSEGSALLGKQVTYDDGSGNLTTGTAESVFVDSQGGVKIVIDGERIDLGQITGIATAASAAPTNPPTTPPTTPSTP